MTVENNWHPKIKDFVRYVREDASQCGVRIYLYPYKYIWDYEVPKTHPDAQLFGYFLSPTRKKSGRIVIAAGLPLPTVIHTLAHEYAHFVQWRTKQACYTKNQFVAYERNAEIKAIKLLGDFDLPINIKVRMKRSKQYINDLIPLKKRIVNKKSS